MFPLTQLTKSAKRGNIIILETSRLDEGIIEYMHMYLTHLSALANDKEYIYFTLCNPIKEESEVD